jgi:hypothetical protein
MKTRSILLTLALCFVAALGFAQNPVMGAWKLNEAKSNFPAGAPKNTMVVYEAVGDKIQCTIDGVEAEGEPTHSIWVGKFDGKDYPLTGDPAATTRAYNVVDDHTLELINKKNGNTGLKARITVSPDGKTRTVTVTGVDASGKKAEYKEVYDKQ